jgi:hypothetical protein
LVEQKAKVVADLEVVMMEDLVVGRMEKEVPWDMVENLGDILEMDMMEGLAGIMEEGVVVVTVEENTEGYWEKEVVVDYWEVEEVEKEKEGEVATEKEEIVAMVEWRVEEMVVEHSEDMVEVHLLRKS